MATMYQGFTILANEYREDFFSGSYREGDVDTYLNHMSEGEFPDGTKILSGTWLAEPVDSNTIDKLVAKAIKELKPIS